MTSTMTLPSAEQLRALGDPTRLAILALLRTRDHCVCHLVEQLGLKQSLVSHHVGLLRRAGLVTSYQYPGDRRWVYYQLNRDALQEITAQLGWLVDDGDYDPTPLPCGGNAAESRRP